MTDQFIIDKRKELKTLRIEYKEVSRQLKEIRSDFTNKKIEEMIHHGVIHTLCDHDTVNTTNPFDVGGVQVVECVSCGADLIKVGNFQLTKEENNLVGDLEHKHREIFNNSIDSTRSDISNLLARQRQLAIQYTEIKDEIGAMLLEGLRATGLITTCDHKASSEQKKCINCGEYVWIMRFKHWLTSDELHILDEVIYQIPEFDVVARTTEIYDYIKGDPK